MIRTAGVQPAVPPYPCHSLSSTAGAGQGHRIVVEVNTIDPPAGRDPGIRLSMARSVGPPGTMLIGRTWQFRVDHPFDLFELKINLLFLFGHLFKQVRVEGGVTASA